MLAALIAALCMTSSDALYIVRAFPSITHTPNPLTPLLLSSTTERGHSSVHKNGEISVPAAHLAGAAFLRHLSLPCPLSFSRDHPSLLSGCASGHVRCSSSCLIGSRKQASTHARTCKWTLYYFPRRCMVTDGHTTRPLTASSIQSLVPRSAEGCSEQAQVLHRRASQGRGCDCALQVARPGQTAAWRGRAEVPRRVETGCDSGHPQGV